MPIEAGLDRTMHQLTSAVHRRNVANKMSHLCAWGVLSCRSSIRRLSPSAALAASLAVAAVAPAQASGLQWRLTNPGAAAPSSRPAAAASGGLPWRVVPRDPVPQATPTAPDVATASGLSWRTRTPEQIQEQRQESKQQLLEAQDEQRQLKAVIPSSGPTYANFRALWRDGDWLPQISSLVPVGYGPKGVMLTLYGRGLDCQTGKGECPGFTTYSAWQSSINQLGSGQLEQVIGFGDPIKAFSVVLNNSSEGLVGSVRSGTLDSTNVFTGNQTGVHLAKAFGPDTSIRTGIDNLIRWDGNSAFYDPLSFYAVATQRIRINDNRSPWFSSLYVTAGVGNGDYRPIEQIVQAQTAALRAAGCPTYGYSPKKPCSRDAYDRAIQSGSNYGTFNPIGSIGLEVYRGVNLITEWTGRNLNIGMSWRPIPQWGFVITPMVQSVIQNCEYSGCRVSMPGAKDPVELPSSVLTQRARLSLQASVEVKF
jgi:hypothetical protein